MILVLAGTKDSREIIKRLQGRGKHILASVVTDYGYDLIAKTGIRVIKKKLDQQGMAEIIRQEGIKMIIDATHPFAQEVSQNAIEISKKLGIDYIRFERREVDIIRDKLEEKKAELIIQAADFQEAARIAKKYTKIFLTIGSNNLEYFIKEINDWQERLVIRVLADWPFVKKARDLGFTPANIIAMQGPYSKELNKVLLRDYRINLLITKASGKSGGLDTKLEAAFELGIPVLLIKRPKMNYGKVFRSYKDLITEVESKGGSFLGR